jgi:predicted site-specific integrase-resolvase
MSIRRLVLTTAQAKKRLNCSADTLRRYHKDGKVEVERLPSGHRRYIFYEEVADVAIDRKKMSHNAKREELKKNIEVYDTLVYMGDHFSDLEPCEAFTENLAKAKKRLVEFDLENS